MYNLFYRSKLGLLEIVCDDEFLLEINYLNFGGRDNPNELCHKVKNEFEEYFNHQRKSFSIPIKLTGTAFQNKVWKAIMDIPFGKLITYNDIAKEINTKATRAVGRAVGANKMLVIIPCHRVIGSNNTLTGFSAGLDNKIMLLELESHTIEINDNLQKSMIKS